MNLLIPASIEEFTINFLQKKPLSGAELLAKIRESRPQTTKQALYAALRKLKSAEIVVMAHMRISLSSVWVIKMTEFFQTAKHFYTKTALTDEGFLNLGDGDRISYSFKSPNLTDIFWGHAFDILSEVTPITEPIYIYNPHEWFFLARHETEKTLFQKITKSGKQILVIVGGTTYLDKMVSKEFDGEFSQYYPTKNPLFPKRNYYINVFGDFIIEAWLDEDISRKLDDFYEKTTHWDLLAQEKIRELVAGEGRNKLVISKNSRRASKIKRMFATYFHIKKN